MLKIITDGWPETNEVLLDEVTCKYMQEPDCTEDRDGDPQTLTLSTRDGGGGKFVHIKTEGWSIDQDSNDLMDIINDFKKRINDIT